MNLKAVAKLFLFLNIFIFSAFAQSPKIALVLSGGGAKGLAEIPLIEELENQGIKPDIILGTSMGALIGSLYAAGYSPKQIRQTLLSMDFSSILNERPAKIEKIPPSAFSRNSGSISVSFSILEGKIGSAPGVIGDQKILCELNNHLSKVMHIKDFDELPIPFRAVGTNVSTGEQLVFKNGSLVTAVRASISIPAIFTPAPVDDGIYAMDGGLRNNLPVKLAKEMGANIIIAMDVASVVDTDPKTISDFYSVGVQIFNLIISSNAVEQYEYADIVLRPDLSKFTTLDFKHPEGIIKAGELCVQQNKEQLTEIVQRIKSYGRQLETFDYNRVSTYDKMPNPVVTNIAIKDISFTTPCPLPKENQFEKYIGKEFDDDVKKSLTKQLERLRDYYHLSSLSYFLDCNEDTCTLEVLANHYEQKMSRVFFGGSSSVAITNYSPQQYLSIYPNLSLGVHLIEPIESLFRISSVNSSINLDFSVLPLIANFGEYSLNLDFGNSLKYGSLEPKTNSAYDDRDIAEDRGVEFYGGLRFKFMDYFVFRTSIAHSSEKINSTDEWHNILYSHNELIFTNLHNNYILLHGGKFESIFNVGGRSDVTEQDFMYNLKFAAEQRFEIVDEKNSIGIGTIFSSNRFPYELNSGYSDFGGIEGMCGHPEGTLKRDFSILELSYRQKILNMFGMPLYTIATAKGAIVNDYDPFVDTDSPPWRFFSDTSFEFGGGIYLALHTILGNLIVGGSANLNKDWVIMVGLK